MHQISCHVIFVCTAQAVQVHITDLKSSHALNIIADQVRKSNIYTKRNRSSVAWLLASMASNPRLLLLYGFHTHMWQCWGPVLECKCFLLTYLLTYMMLAIEQDINPIRY